jgi:glutamate-1-semialdehyde 2,1-aminomutase
MGERPQDESQRLAARAGARLPGGVNSNVRLGGPQTFFARGEGAWLWDVDGNDYVDYLLGQGPAFLGHAPAPVVAAVEEASREGMVFGAQNPLEVEAAERVCDALRWPDMVRFGSSGSEMVHAALRLARAATGRRRFVRFEGHYHGWFDNIFVSMETGLGPASAGQLPSHLDDAVVLPWNDLNSVATAFADADDIGAVITEPVMCNSGCIQPHDGYLEGLREICDATGAVLIFDEIITGFRLALGGATARYGVTPDLATYGKAMAGGWPVAALAGRGELMERIGTGVVNHSGTFNANLMGGAAVVAAIDALTADPPYRRVESHGERLMQGLRKIGDEAGLPLRVAGLPMAFHASFAEGDVEVRDFRDLGALDLDRYRAFARTLAEHGVWVAGRGIWYVSAAHGDRELDAALERVEEAVTRSSP